MVLTYYLLYQFAPLTSVSKKRFIIWVSRKKPICSKCACAPVYASRYGPQNTTLKVTEQRAWVPPSAPSWVPPWARPWARPWAPCLQTQLLSLFPCCSSWHRVPPLVISLWVPLLAPLLFGSLMEFYLAGENSKPDLLLVRCHAIKAPTVFIPNYSLPIPFKAKQFLKCLRPFLSQRRRCQMKYERSVSYLS